MTMDKLSMVNTRKLANNVILCVNSHLDHKIKKVEPLELPPARDLRLRRVSEDKVSDPLRMISSLLVLFILILIFLNYKVCLFTSRYCAIPAILRTTLRMTTLCFGVENQVLF